MEAVKFWACLKIATIMKIAELGAKLKLGFCDTTRTSKTLIA